MSKASLCTVLIGTGGITEVQIPL